MRFPTDEEVSQVFKDLLDGREFTQRRKLTDVQGVYLWEIRTTDRDGSTMEYLYQRKGIYPEGSAGQSRIDCVYLDEQDNPIGGDSVAKFIDGKWVIV